MSPICKCLLRDTLTRVFNSFFMHGGEVLLIQGHEGSLITLDDTCIALIVLKSNLYLT